MKVSSRLRELSLMARPVPAWERRDDERSVGSDTCDPLESGAHRLMKSTLITRWGCNVDEVGEALQMNPKDFKEKYNEVKPSKSDSLVFSCLAGVRSKKALDTALSLGFNSDNDAVVDDNESSHYS
ncbi:hypothetical protein CB1_001389002 [Camelus ferus]|nr:hypothetical protein CB1_001389002 [Camelus ferus]